MKRRLSTLLSALATATLLAVAVPTSAHAADGTITVNGTAYPEPAGCLDIGGPQPLSIDNDTDEEVIVFLGGGCGGVGTGTLQPGDSGTFLGSSVLVP